MSDEYASALNLANQLPTVAVVAGVEKPLPRPNENRLRIAWRFAYKTKGLPRIGIAIDRLSAVTYRRWDSRYVVASGFDGA